MAETVRVFNEFAWTNKEIREVSKQLDPTNITILSTMAEVGPRNLLEVSRLTGIPFTTVYHRISKIETQAGRVVSLIPNVAKLGMVRLVVLVASKPGLEDTVTQALRIPNYWRVIERCEGAFTHHSIQTVPVKFLKAFKNYVSTMYAMNLIKSFRIIPTSDSYSIFADFSSYNSASGEWTFHWDEWLKDLTMKTATNTIEDQQGKPMNVAKVDVEIITYLEENGRMNFVDIAKKINASPQAVKYHYDNRLVPSGAVTVGQYHFDVAPYPVELSAYHEFMLDFTDSAAMNRFFSLAKKLFFVDHLSKAVRKTTLMVRTRMINSQVENMFAFFSEMVNSGILTSYSAVRLNLNSRLRQTLSCELFDEAEGWKWDVYNVLLELNKL
ncbi:MAG: winged helix-turn-helix domain-containing protein [Candidatus Bathyarchaeia archaeon]